MKYKVRHSSFVRWESLLLVIFYFSCLGYFIHRGEIIVALVLVLALAFWGVLSLVYSPLLIDVEDDSLSVKCPLKTKTILVADIASAKHYTPSAKERRVFGNGGLFGYWGWFSDSEVGKYFAYYGKTSDCFLVTLKDGSKYLLGCENSDEVLEYISKRLG